MNHSDSEMIDFIPNDMMGRINVTDVDVREYETKKFLRRRPFFKDGEKDRCKKSVRYEIQSNTNHEKFNHLFYHAGSLNNFERYGLLPLRTQKLKPAPQKSLEIPHLDPLFGPISLETVKNTFDYIFTKFKKGIFVVIKDKRLLVFLPFSNADYRNDFFPFLAIDKKDHENLKRMEHLIHKMERLKIKRRRLPKSLLKEYENHNRNAKSTIKGYMKRIGHRRPTDLDRTRWVANNCMFRNSYPTFEGDQNVNVVEAFLVKLLKEREIPDCCFFMNIRDHPIITKDGTEPYFHLFGSGTRMRSRFIHENYAPILSFSPHQNGADYPFINVDDMKRVLHGYVFPDKCDSFFQRQYDLTPEESDKKKAWMEKIGKIIFRGKATGCGIKESNNVRLKAVRLSELHPDIIDAGIVNRNQRLKKYEGELMTLLKDKIPMKPFMGMEEQSRFKYHLILDGHVAAYRTGGMFSLNALIMMPKSPYRIWLSHLLQPGIHFIELREDLGDLVEKWIWCEKHPDECFEIIRNGNRLFEKYLNTDGVLDYAQLALTQISQRLSNDFIPKQRVEKSPKILIGSIYRDTDGTRKAQYEKFIEYWPKLLAPYTDAKVDIMVAEQSKEHRFNRGALCNIIIEYSKKHDYDNVFIVDIDTLLSSDGMKYLFKPIEGIRLMALTGTRYTQDDNMYSHIFFGAFIGLNPKNIPNDFDYYPNQIFGWGIEDDILMARAARYQIDIEPVPGNISVLDLEDEHPTIKSKMEKTVQTDHRWEKYIYYTNSLKEKEELRYETLTEHPIKKLGNGLSLIHNIYKVWLDPEFEKQVTNKTSEIKNMKDEYKNTKKEVYRVIYQKAYHKH